MFSDLAEELYLDHYTKKISPNLSYEQKHAIASKISELTLQAPIWLDRNKDYSDVFPELKPFINVRLSGLYLTTIMKGIINDLQKEAKE